MRCHACFRLSANEAAGRRQFGRWLPSVSPALPMIAIMAASTGMILALQGAGELRRFGALRYVIDLVAMGFTRELGPLLTAIVVSGRSGSAFSAEIGTMMVTNEIDALRTLALDPLNSFWPLSISPPSSWFRA